jgi:hypothetical protein
MTMADAFKQLRSMILLELYCPPLPVMAKRQETDEPIITNTHDMMSVFMITSFKRQDDKENQKRREKQIEIVHEYQAGLEMCTKPVEAYAHMKKFSSKYLATYLLPDAGFTEQDILILPMDQISPNLKNEIRSYCAALRLVENLDENDNNNDTSLLLSDQCVDSLFMSCISSAIHKKQQRIVCQSILECVGKDIGKESHDPDAFESGVEVL